MLVLLVFGVLSSLGFRKKLLAKGYPQSKGWVFPLLIGSILITFNFFLKFVSGFWIKNPESSLARGYPYVVSFLTLLVFGLVVSRLWKQIQKLPDLSHRN